MLVDGTGQGRKSTESILSLFTVPVRHAKRSAVATNIACPGVILYITDGYMCVIMTVCVVSSV